MAATMCAGGWSRRRFLQLASLSAAAGVWPRLAFAQEGAAAGAPLSVGYVLGSEEAADVLRPAWWSPFRTASLVRAAGESAFAAAQAPLEVVPADQLLGDPRLAVVPVRVAVLGLYPEVDDVPGFTFDMVLTVHFFTGDPFLPVVPFHAWGWRDDPAVTAGAPIRFTVPVERDTGLRFSLDVRQVERGRRVQTGGTAVRRPGGSQGGGAVGGAGGGLKASPGGTRTAWSQAAVLSVGVEPGVAKLQRGTYLLGLEPRMWEQGGELPAGAFPDDLPPSLVVAVEAFEE